MSTQELQAYIEKAFHGVAFPRTYSLRQCALIDDWCTDPIKQSAARAQDFQGHWSEIPEADLYNFYYALCYFDAEGMQYYLPAFMVFTLQGTRQSTDMFCHILFQLIDCNSTDDKAKYVLLTPMQRSAVQAYLEWALNRSTDRAEQISIRNALKSYWGQFKDWSVV